MMIDSFVKKYKSKAQYMYSKDKKEYKEDKITDL
jgi:hypothetical protein